MTNGTVLVVEDDEAVAGLYARNLEPDYRIDVATTVEEALSALDSGVAVALIDRRLPDGEGREVVDAIADKGLDCRVAMVTGVKPDFDILDAGFDLYVLKPVSTSDLRATVDTLFARSAYEDLLAECASVASRQALLELSVAADADHRDLAKRREELDDELSEIAGSFSTDDFRALFRDLGRA